MREFSYVKLRKQNYVILRQLSQSARRNFADVCVCVCMCVRGGRHYTFVFSFLHYDLTPRCSPSRREQLLKLSLLLHPASCRFTKYHTTNKCTNCMSFILNHFFKTLFTAPTCFDSISLIIIREHACTTCLPARETTYTNTEYAATTIL